MAFTPYWGDESVMREQNLAPDILAYGDSWFWYPNNNLMTPINNLWHGNKTLLVKGKNGAELRDLVGGTPRLWEDFRFAMSGYKSSIRCLMLSAGGNDFVGIQNLQALLRADCRTAQTVDDCFDPGDPANNIERQPWRMLRTIAHDYQALIDFVRSVNPTLPILLHDYDYSIPSGIGFGGHVEGLFGLGDWLKKPMDLRGVPVPLQSQIVNRLIRDFSAVLSALADPKQNNHVRLVHTAGTLFKFEWANEMHPTPAGFARLVSDKFAPVLSEIFPI
jgi:hypothetical protein